MMGIGKKINLYMNILMGVTLSFFLSLVGIGTSGHFTIKGWLISFVLSFIMSIVIGFIVPVKKFTDKVNNRFNLPDGTIKNKGMNALLSDLIYTPLITFIMICMAFNQISNGINGGITEINKQKEELQAQITNNESVIAELESSEKNDKNITEINQQLEELKSTNEVMMTSITNMETKITEMEESIPPFIIMYIGSLIKTIIAGFIIIGIVQPIYLNMLLKKFDVLE